MPPVNRPRIKGPVVDDEDDAPAPRRGYMPYSWPWLRQKVTTYAFGTLVCGALMIALAAWMGGTLGVFGKRMDSGMRVLMHSVGLTVENIKIVGLKGLVKERALEVMGVKVGDSMLAADPGDIKHRLEKLDAVGQVSVHRFWPDQITIIAEAREPMALWNDGASWRVVDQHGRAFAEVEPNDYMKLPRVKGANAAAATPDLLTVLADYPDLRSKLDSATRVGGRRWDVKFKGGVDVALPEDERLKSALAALNLAEARNRLLELPLIRIDARNPDRFALRPIPGAPTIVLGGA